MKNSKLNQFATSPQGSEGPYEKFDLLCFFRSQRVLAISSIEGLQQLAVVQLVEVQECVNDKKAGWHLLPKFLDERFDPAMVQN